MRVVVDTNVFIGACIGRGASSKVIEACIQGLLTPVMSNALYLEYEDIIERAELFRRARLNTAERNALLDIFLGKSVLCDIYFLWRPNLRDEGDNHVVDLAVAGRAQYIITNNLRDFRETELKFDHLQVVKPEMILEVLAR